MATMLWKLNGRLHQPLCHYTVLSISGGFLLHCAQWLQACAVVCTWKNAAPFFFPPPTGLSIDNCSKLQQRKTCFQSAVLFFCFSGNTVQKPEIRLRMSEVRLVLDLSVYLRWESFFLASSHICTFFQSGWFWKIYPEVTIQDQWNGVCRCAHTLSCLSVSFCHSGYLQHQHTHALAHIRTESICLQSLKWVLCGQIPLLRVTVYGPASF